MYMYVYVYVCIYTTYIHLVRIDKRKQLQLMPMDLHQIYIINFATNKNTFQ